VDGKIEEEEGTLPGKNLLTSLDLPPSALISGGNPIVGKVDQ
jgi:hypothetical protein